MRPLALLLLLSLPALAKPETRSVTYKEGEVELEGYFSRDSKFKGKRPGILVVHEWKGLDDYAKMRADKLASLGYAAFAVDIYGKGVRPQSTEEAGKVSGSYKSNPDVLRARIKAGLETLKKQKGVDTSKIAAIGYCFGGTTVLELARSGADVKGVVSFHGDLASQDRARSAGAIKAHVLVLHGVDDPYVKKADIDGFVDEMQRTKAEWQMTGYGNAVHGFTNPHGGSDNSKGYAYNELADKRSWAAMQAFFKEIF